MSLTSHDRSDPGLRGSAFVRLLDPFFVLRPTLMFPLWTMTLAGAGLVKQDITISPFRWFLLSVALSAMFGLVYFLNQIKDKKTDKINNKLFLIANGVFSRSQIIIETILLILLAVICLILSDFGHIGLWMMGLFVLIGLLYNYTPFALKQHPWGGMVAYALSGWMFLRLGQMIYGYNSELLYESPYIFAFIVGCLLTNLPDLEGDKAADKRTFTVVYGINTTIITGITGYSISLILGLYARDWVIFIPPACTLPFLIYGYFSKNLDLVVRANKWAIFLLSVTVGIKFPVYLVAIILYFPLARWYHKARFGINYPSFS